MREWHVASIAPNVVALLPPVSIIVLHTDGTINLTISDDGIRSCTDVCGRVLETSWDVLEAMEAPAPVTRSKSEPRDSDW